MARKITPRHIARASEAERKVPKPSRFNQKSTSDNPNYMYPLNRSIPEGIPDAELFGAESVERCIRETINKGVDITITLTIDAESTNPALSIFLDNQGQPTGQSYAPRWEYFKYENTIYDTTEIILNEREDIEIHTIDSSIPNTYTIQRPTVIIMGRAVPDIVKIKMAGQGNG